METVDAHRHVQWRKDQTARLKKRASDHFKKHELDGAIEKAGKDSAQRMGFIDKSGKKNRGGL
jgi:hypothetical protein